MVKNYKRTFIAQLVKCLFVHIKLLYGAKHGKACNFCGKMESSLIKVEFFSGSFPLVHLPLGTLLAPSFQSANLSLPSSDHLDLLMKTVKYRIYHPEEQGRKVSHQREREREEGDQRESRGSIDWWIAHQGARSRARRRSWVIDWRICGTFRSRNLAPPRSSTPASRASSLLPSLRPHPPKARDCFTSDVFGAVAHVFRRYLIHHIYHKHPFCFPKRCFYHSPYHLFDKMGDKKRDK